MIEVHERFKVLADTDSVWLIVSNPHDVVACIPGAQLQEHHADGTYSGTMQIKFGPVQVTFSARVTFEVNEHERIGRVKGKGKDMAGTRSEIEFIFSVTDGNPGTVLKGDGLVTIRGPLANMIEAGAAIVIKRLLGDFSENITQLASRQTQIDAVMIPSEKTTVGLWNWIRHSINFLIVGKSSAKL